MSAMLFQCFFSNKVQGWNLGGAYFRANSSDSFKMDLKAAISLFELVS